KLNHVLTAKPHERRVFIEEAAGIARYKQQRNETQGKLDAARQNLVRVRDVMDEVKRQLGSLERQARKAQQYKALQTEKRDLAMGLVASEYAALTAEGRRLGDELERLRDAALALERDHAEALRLEQTRLASERVDLMRSAGELREREVQLARRAERLAAELAQARAEAGQLVTERVVLTAARDRAAAEFGSL